MRRPAFVLLLALVMFAALSSCAEDRTAPRPTPSADRKEATAAFAKAYAEFRADFDAATTIGEKDGLENARRSVRAVRAAYADLGSATRRIEMPSDVADDVTAMLDAFDELGATLDKQAEATTAEDFQAANPESSAALQQADDAIQVVVDALGLGSTTDPGGATRQRKVEAAYLSGETVRDADAWVADLLRIGADHANHQTPSEDMGVVAAWRAAFPDILGESNVVGYEREAPKNGVSGFAVLPEDGKNPASRSNPYYLAFAARDDSGTCAGGVLSGYPDPSEKRRVELSRGSRCTGAAVAAAAGY